jgi:nitroreductase
MLEVIRRRRSIRKYRDLPVDDLVIEELLRAAMQAPSARNLQPWEFIVISDRETLERIPEYHPYSSMVPGAAAAILVCGDKGLLEDPGYLALDCAAAVQNLLLEAVNQDLGAVWLGVFPRSERMEGMTRLFNLPNNIVPVALISIGHPDEDPGMEDRFRPERVHRDSW